MDDSSLFQLRMGEFIQTELTEICLQSWHYQLKYCWHPMKAMKILQIKDLALFLLGFLIFLSNLVAPMAPNENNEITTNQGFGTFFY